MLRISRLTDYGTVVLVAMLSNKKDLISENEYEPIDNNLYKKINQTGIKYEDIILASAQENWGIKEIKSSIHQHFN